MTACHSVQQKDVMKFWAQSIAGAGISATIWPGLSEALDGWLGNCRAFTWFRLSRDDIEKTCHLVSSYKKLASGVEPHGWSRWDYLKLNLAVCLQVLCKLTCDSGVKILWGLSTCLLSYAVDCILDLARLCGSCFRRCIETSERFLSTKQKECLHWKLQ